MLYALLVRTPSTDDLLHTEHVPVNFVFSSLFCLGAEMSLLPDSRLRESCHREIPTCLPVCCRVIHSREGDGYMPMPGPAC